MGIPTGWELILLLGVLVLLFGATKLPTAARSLGQSMRIFKAETKGLRSDDEEGAQDGGRQAAPPVQPDHQLPQQALPRSNTPIPAPVEQPQRGSDTRGSDTSR